MKLLITIAIFIALGCQSNNCDEGEISVFTHYQINQGTLEARNNEFVFEIYDNPNGTVIFNLPSDEEAGWEIVIEESQGDYFRIRNIWSLEYVSFQGGHWANVWKNDWMKAYKNVWIKKGSVGTSTHNYDGETVTLFKQPNEESEVVGELHEVQTVQVVDVCGEWAYVEGIGKDGKTQGWLSPKDQCSSPYTTCP